MSFPPPFYLLLTLLRLSYYQLGNELDWSASNSYVKGGQKGVGSFHSFNTALMRSQIVGSQWARRLVATSEGGRQAGREDKEEGSHGLLATTGRSLWRHARSRTSNKDRSMEHRPERAKKKYIYIYICICKKKDNLTLDNVLNRPQQWTPSIMISASDVEVGRSLRSQSYLICLVWGIFFFIGCTFPSRDLHTAFRSTARFVHYIPGRPIMNCLREREKEKGKKKGNSSRTETECGFWMDVSIKRKKKSKEIG